MRQSQPPVLVSGAHRSGSTWAGQIISQAPGVGYLHEPFNANPMYPGVSDVTIRRWFLYLPPNQRTAYFDHFQALLQWRYRGRKRLANVRKPIQLQMWLKYAFLYRRNKGRRMCMKDPLALFSAEWLVHHFGMMPVMMIRHPAAFAYSLKRKQWGLPYEDFLAQPALIDRFFKEEKALIVQYRQEKRPILEQAALLWRLLYKVVRYYRESYPSWYFLTHEQLSLAPMAQIQRLFDHLGLEMTPRVTAFIAQTTDASNPGQTQSDEELLRRDAKSNATYWQRKMSPSEIARVAEITRPVWPDFYTQASWGGML